jgi:NADPH:quinone reductase-like Zn-dependent oxidoreductase
MTSMALSSYRRGVNHLADDSTADTGRMMAVRAHQRGGPETLVYEPAPRPSVAADEVMVAVDAAGITFAELSWDPSWTDDAGRDRTPVIPAHEVAGSVIEVGSAVSSLSLGDEVFGLVPFTHDGAAAELVAMPAAILAGRPRTISAVEAASLPLAALTAWQALVGHAGVQLGERVLVHGGAGGVGVYVVQIAAWLGAEVIATAGADDLDFVGSLGASRVLDYATEPFRELLSDIDVVIDTVGGDTLLGSFDVVRRGGRIVTLSAPAPVGMAEQFGVSATFFIVEPNRDDLTQIATLVDAGDVRPVVSQTFPLSATREAYESATRPHPPGKTVLVVR